MTPINIILPSYINGAPRYNLAEASRILGIARRRIAKLARERKLGINAEGDLWFTQEEIDNMATGGSHSKAPTESPRP